MSSEFIDVRGWDEVIRGRMKRGKLGSLEHLDPIFKYPDIILQKNKYFLN